MKKNGRCKALFLDIGGVLLTDGWNRKIRDQAIAHFGLDHAEFDDRHHLNFTTLENGKLSLDEYMERVVFYEERSFTPAEFRDYMFAQSTAYSEMLELMAEIKDKFDVKVTVVSNEGRELNEHRIHKFKLHQFVDSFVSSCYVGIRKPDLDIYRLALDMTHVRPSEVIYVENTPLFVEIGESLGIPSIHHTDYASTREKLTELGFEV